MQRIVNPKQTRLFDPFDNVLTKKTRKRLLDGWAGVFRHVILELMPVETISGYFDPAMGRPILVVSFVVLYLDKKPIGPENLQVTFNR